MSFKGAKSIFQGRRFHWRRRCRIVTSLLTRTWTGLFNNHTLEGAYWVDCVDDVDNDQTLQPAVVWYWYNLWIPLIPRLRPAQKETSQPVNYIKSQRHYYITTIIYHLLYIYFFCISKSLDNRSTACNTTLLLHYYYTINHFLLFFTYVRVCTIPPPPTPYLL